jgi:hypothetical protein
MQWPVAHATYAQLQWHTPHLRGIMGLSLPLSRPRMSRSDRSRSSLHAGRQAGRQRGTSGRQTRSTTHLFSILSTSKRLSQP